jgi:hypothetical protein
MAGAFFRILQSWFRINLCLCQSRPRIPHADLSLPLVCIGVIQAAWANNRSPPLCRSSAQSSRWRDDLGADVLSSFGISPIAGTDSVGLLVRIRFHLFLPQRNANRAGSGATRGCGEVATVSARPDIQLTRMEHLAVCDLPGERSIHVARRRAPGRAAWPVISATFRRRPAHLPTA